MGLRGWGWRDKKREQRDREVGLGREKKLGDRTGLGAERGVGSQRVGVGIGVEKGWEAERKNGAKMG